MIVALVTIWLIVCFMLGWFMVSGRGSIDRSSIRDFITVDQYLKVDGIHRDIYKNTPNDSLDLHQNTMRYEQSYAKDSKFDDHN